MDAVGAAVMGFDPMADRGVAPFETCDNTLRLAEELGVGTRDLKRFEVIGARIGDVVLDYRRVPAGRRASAPRPLTWRSDCSIDQRSLLSILHPGLVRGGLLGAFISFTSTVTLPILPVNL